VRFFTGNFADYEAYHLALNGFKEPKPIKYATLG